VLDIYPMLCYTIGMEGESRKKRKTKIAEN